MVELDEIDSGILYLLQGDARHNTPVDLAESLPVTAQTVRNRLEKLEGNGVIQGYVPEVNYQKAGFPIRIQFTCTAPVEQRSELADEALELANVVEVEEMMSAKSNLHVLAVTTDSEVINDVSAELSSLGLTIEQEQLQRAVSSCPFTEFEIDALE
jgi:DNA-binding Lrp family transcriptional regulator